MTKFGRLGMEALETREVPAVLASVVGNELRVSVNNDSTTAQHVRIFSGSRGELVVNNEQVRVNGRTVATSAVGRITITGSELNNDIDLTGVNRARFLGLNGRITVDARGGNDSITGSEFDETLRGGNGNDRIYAQNGNDTLYGDAGDDTLVGGNGNDRFYGGSGSDRFFGQAGTDTAFDFMSNDARPDSVEVVFRA